MKQVTTFHRRTYTEVVSKDTLSSIKPDYGITFCFYSISPAAANITPRIHIFFDEYDYCCVHRYKN